MGLDNPIHIAFLLILLLLVFGAKRLPELGRSLGTGMRGFKESLSGEGMPPAQLHEPAQMVAANADAPLPGTVGDPVAPAASTPAAGLDRQHA
ncbi:MAG TPA: twin-arginine translocase TatA/TatE family subunit [Solirubrobacteraceae bacterium]|nr:twin-arginine translocase TatA/TatE family subunit [Solirubrobacteraceae bacterium]